MFPIERFFNTAGPVRADLHYLVPPLERIDLPHVLRLIAQQKYFVLHAPRQTGKTSCLLALMQYLNASGQYRALYVNIENAQAAREDVPVAMPAIVQTIARRAADTLEDSEAWALALATVKTTAPLDMVGAFLAAWCQRSPKPTVLFLDEVDSLIGDTLIALLRQLRGNYDQRPARFPQSIILCGVRDVRDYRIHSAKEKTIITGGSAFNIKAESLRLGDFTRPEMEYLYTEHSRATGQVFAPAALALAWDLTRGQPWLVNALGYETCFNLKAGQDRTQPITPALMQQAKEALILRRETHLDQLADKLREDRVRRVIAPLVTGDPVVGQLNPDDIAYVRDLGLVRTEGGLAIANRIYQEVIPRELTYDTQLVLTQETQWYVRPDGRLDMAKLLAAFQEFFRAHSEHWVERFDYKEAGPQLLLQAFLQRIVNGGGRVEREYGLGRKRTDLLVWWQGGAQQVVIELKVTQGDIEKTITEGLAQTWEYADRCGAAEAHLVIFDRTPGKAWGEKIFHRVEAHRGLPITVWGM